MTFALCRIPIGGWGNVVSVSTKTLKYGDRLASDVYTKRNNLLMQKGTVLTLREIEILQAFLIDRVEIVDGSEDAVEAAASAEPVEATESATGLAEGYMEMVTFVKKLFLSVSAGAQLNALEVRRRTEALLKHIDEYRPITFKPARYVTKDYFYHHSVCVAMTSYLLAKWIGLPKKDWLPAALAGLLHNIGLTAIDEDIINKPKALTQHEMNRMREHTVIGYSILKPIAGFNNGVKVTALQHHERNNGSGYPLGLTGESIHPYAKIVAVADTYHAMSLDRVYRNAVSPYLVLEELNEFSFGILDPVIVRALLDKTALFATGMIVRLSDGRIGEIVFIQREYPTRPWVNVDGTIINLTQEKALHIDAILGM